jgi:integrase/recombinase XerD
MPNLSQEIAINIIDEIIKIVPYFQVDVQKQIQLRNKVEEQLNGFEITSRCTDLVKGDILEKAFVYLSCKRLEGMKETTSYNYRLLFKRMGAYFIKPISTITTIDLRLFMAKEYGNNSPASMNNKICKIKAFFQWMQDEGYIVQNPARNLQLAKEPYRKRGHIPQMDVEKMREQCRTIREKALFEFLLSTGCRVSEVSDATLDKIDWDDNSITVIGKGDKERTVIFSTRARLFLMNYLSNRQSKGILSNSLFVSSKKPYLPLGRRSIEKDVAKIAVRSGITYDVFPHLFRHTFATSGVNHDVPVHVLQQLMGHTSADTTQVYYDLSEDNIKQEYKKMVF